MICLSFLLLQDSEGPLEFERFLKQSAVHLIIVRDKNFHNSTFVLYSSSSGIKFASSFSKSVKRSVISHVFPSRPICSSRLASATARGAERQESIPLKAWLVVSTRFVSWQAMDSCNSNNRGGYFFLKIATSSIIKSRSLPTRKRSSVRFMATCRGAS